MLLVVGLGNPGPQYRNTRHNAGFLVLDRLTSKVGGSEWREKYAGLSSRAVVAGREALLLKPQTFMNLSGRSVQKAMTELKVPLGSVIVVHDDLDLPFGTVRAKAGGGHGGHNGLRDISGFVGTEFLRIRVGIGRPSVEAVEHWVLSGFSKDEQLALDRVLDEAVSAVESLAGEGPEKTMNKTNQRKRGG